MLARWMLLAAAATAFAQPKFEIRGSVVEPGVEVSQTRRSRFRPLTSAISRCGQMRRAAFV